MNKKWDSDKGGRDKWIAWLTEGMKECLRLLKPGGMALVWSIPRTAHWTATAIEDAGFEIRDKIYHVFGQGFKKGLDIGKAIDRRGGKAVSWFGPWFRQWRRKRGISSNEVAKLFPSKTGGETGCVRNWELGLNMPTAEQFTIICEAFDLPFGSIEEAEREVIGKDRSGLTNWFAEGGDFDITAPATPEAQRFANYGTGLKPSVEEWILAMKPLDGTFAENALRHGIAGLNIDGCRIKTEHQKERITKSNKPMYGGNSLLESKTIQTTSRDGSIAGRWPSNLLLQHFPECREIGMKKVKGSHPSGLIKGEKRDYKETTAWFGKDSSIDSNSDYTNPNGTETVPAYECAAGCPCGHVWATKELTECPECGCRKIEWVCAVRMLDEQSGILISKWGESTSKPTNGIFSKNFKYTDRKTERIGDKGSASRFYYCAKSSRTERELGLKGHIPCVKCGGLDTDWHLDEKGEKVKCVRNDHPTVKSQAIIDYLCKLTMTPDGGTVLDPFAGTGKTAIACLKLGRKFILIDNDPKYCEISKWAIEAAGKKYGQGKLFKK